MKKIILVLTQLLITSILFSVEITDEGVIFLYEDNSVESVFLVGSMNNWDTSASPMEKGNDGIWRIVVKLNSGKHTYKFVVDGNWQFDQENPSFEDDGYGGSNSVIEIDENGEIVEKYTMSSAGIKSTFNPKIYFKGRYFSDNIFLKNQTDRFMLDKPEHDINFGIKIKFSSDFEGYTVLNVNNHDEGSEMWKTHFNFKRAYLRIKADYFDVTAFDNCGLVSFDDPLHIVGDIGYNGYNFGYNYSGVYVQTSNLLSNKISNILPIQINGKLLFSDRIGNKEDDISAMRLKLSSPIFHNDKLTFGASYYNYTGKPSDQLVQIHDNWEMDFNYTKDFYQPSWKDIMRIEFSTEYTEYDNSNEDPAKSIWMEGRNFFVGGSLQFPVALQIHGSYLHNMCLTGNNMLTSSNTDKWMRDRVTIGARYSSSNIEWNLDGRLWKNNGLDDWENYYKYLEKADGNGRWFQEYSEVPFEKFTVLGYETGFLWESNLSYRFEVSKHRVEAMIKNKFAHHDLFFKPKFIENIIVLKFNISDKWKLKTDTRIPYYNDPFLGIKTDFSSDEDVFVSNYSEISYHLSKNIWLALGCGVNPLTINSVTDKFYDRGREEYLNNAGNLSEYLESNYGELGGKIREAERLLMNENRISIQAVVEF